MRLLHLVSPVKGIFGRGKTISLKQLRCKSSYFQPSSGDRRSSGLPQKADVRQLAVGRARDAGAPTTDVHRPRTPAEIQY